MILVATDAKGTEVVVDVQKIDQMQGRGGKIRFTNSAGASDILDLDTCISVKLLPNG